MPVFLQVGGKPSFLLLHEREFDITRISHMPVFLQVGGKPSFVWHNKNLTHASFFASRWQAVIPLKSGIQKAAIRQTTFIALTGFRFSAEWPITHRLTGIRKKRKPLYAKKTNPYAELTLPESKKTRLSSQLKKTLPHCFSASQRQAVIPLAAWTWVWHNKNLTHASFFASRWQAVIPESRKQP